MNYDLTKGSVLKNLVRFSLPYLLSCFLQTFYGLADLFITGQYNGAAAITAVSVGSQVTHMLTVIIVGLAMGATVTISHAAGAKNQKAIEKGIGNTVSLFIIFSVILTAVLLVSTNGILQILSVPKESLVQAKSYLLICFIGVPFITAYNVISSIFRGLGDSKSPMFFVAVAGIANVILDYILIGSFGMGVAGAALATVIAQAFSVCIALLAFRKMKMGISIKKTDFRFSKQMTQKILKVGVPVAVQDGFIQISFLVITVIANRRGVDVAAAVGIVEKVISFLFLVPSAMLSTVSAIAAQNAGAGLHEQGKKALKYGTLIAVSAGFIFAVICQFCAEDVLRLFAKEEPIVISMGAQYLKSYVFDCVFAGVHFCFSGYFCAYQKSLVSFAHNLASILFVRIPGVCLATALFPDTLYPMGLAAPLGSLLSSIICIIVYVMWQKKEKL